MNQKMKLESDLIKGALIDTMGRLIAQKVQDHRDSDRVVIHTGAVPNILDDGWCGSNAIGMRVLEVINSNIDCRHYGIWVDGSETDPIINVYMEDTDITDDICRTIGSRTEWAGVEIKWYSGSMGDNKSTKKDIDMEIGYVTDATSHILNIISKAEFQVGRLEFTDMDINY